MRTTERSRNRLQATVGLIAMLVLLAPIPAAAGTFDGVVVFGDSLSDNGNLFALTGGAVPASPPYFNGRFSNGPVWNEYLATSLGLPLSNFAVGGAFTGHGNLLSPLLPGVLDEIALFTLLHPGGADPQSLYTIWAGPNDFFASPSPATIGPAVSNIATAVTTLAGLGAVDILVINLPDMGQTPDGLASGVSAGLTALSIAFNSALDATLGGLGLPGLIELDIFSLMDQVIASPLAFGFTDVTIPCLDQVTFIPCLNPDQHLFWDLDHPTTRGHSLIAGFVAEAVPEPASSLLLGAGLIVVGLITRRRRASR